MGRDAGNGAPVTREGAAGGRTGMRRVWTVALATILGIVGVATATAGVEHTQSAWTDTTYTSAVATAGTWSVPVSVGCTAMNANGTPKNGGFCEVLSVAVDQEWGTPGNRMRGYNVRLRSNAQDGYIQFTIDLSSAGSADFSWATAGLTAGSSHVTPNSGWTCADLPKLTGKTPTNWGWGPNSAIYFQITENRSSQAVNCG